MVNSISADFAPPDRWVRMSNGLTSVVLSVLVLSGSDLAQTPWQRRLVAWLAGHDQFLHGIGTVGFGLEEIAWTRAEFPAQQAFLREVAAMAATGHRWQALGYAPRREVVLYELALFDALVRDLPITAADEPTDRWWPDSDPTQRCPVHLVLLHSEGCLLCNDH